MTDSHVHGAWSIRDNDLAQELRDFAIAYPADCFGPVADDELAAHSGLVTRASAAMGRHFAPLFIAAADEIERLRTSISDSVPRSRYDACNADWLAEKAKREEIAAKAVAEIERLQEAINLAVATEGEAQKQAILRAAQGAPK